MPWAKNRAHNVADLDFATTCEWDTICRRDVATRLLTAAGWSA